MRLRVSAGAHLLAEASRSPGGPARTSLQCLAPTPAHGGLLELDLRIEGAVRRGDEEPGEDGRLYSQQVVLAEALQQRRRVADHRLAAEAVAAEGVGGIADRVRRVVGPH